MNERGIEMVSALLVQAQDNAAALALRDRLHREVMAQLQDRDHEEVLCVFCRRS